MTYMQQLRDALNERRLREAEDYFQRANEAKQARDWSREYMLRQIAQRTLDSLT